MSERFVIRHPDGRQYKVTRDVYQRLYVPQGFYRADGVEEETIDVPDPDALFSADDLIPDPVADAVGTDTTDDAPASDADVQPAWHEEV